MTVVAVHFGMKLQAVRLEDVGRFCLILQEESGGVWGYMVVKFRFEKDVFWTAFWNGLDRHIAGALSIR